MISEESHQLTAAQLLTGLQTRRVGRAITVLSQVSSTNDYVFGSVLPKHGREGDGHIVFAEHQTAGRGRLGRSWVSPRGAGLLFSVLLIEPAERCSTARLMMAAGLAVVSGIRQATELEPVLRWPNDIYIRDRKLAGILVETRALAEDALAAALGIGVNCFQHAVHFPQELRDKATSIELESSRAIDRPAVAQAVIRGLDDYLAEPGRLADEQLIKEWRDHSADLGARATLLSQGQTCAGWIIDVHPVRGLLLQLDTGARKEFDAATTARL